MNDLDKIRIKLNCDLPALLHSIAQACDLHDTDGRLAQAATECRTLAQQLKGALIHPQISAADILVKAVDFLRLAGRERERERFETIIRLIKGNAKRRIVGQSVIGAKKLIDKLEASGAKLLGMEHPDSGEAVPIAEVK